jgi:hypothetical protein
MVWWVNPRNKIINGSQASDGMEFIAAKKGRNMRRKVVLIPTNTPNTRENSKAKTKAGNILNKLFISNLISIPFLASSRKEKKVSEGEGINHVGTT